MRLFVIMMFCLSSIVCLGQDIEYDIKHKTYAIPDSVMRNAAGMEGVEPLRLNRDLQKDIYTAGDSLYNSSTVKPYETEIIPNRFDEPGTAYIPLWKNGGILATGQMTVLPGLMRIYSGSIGFGQQIGNLSLYAGALANKYGFFNGLYTQYGVNTSLQYSFNPSLSIVGYGTYYFGQPPLMGNGLPMPPSMIGYFGVSTFGGYVNYQFNETFGLQVGGQAVQQFGTNKYMLEPIVTPTVKVGKVRIGFPVGQIVNGMIRSQMEQRRRR